MSTSLTVSPEGMTFEQLEVLANSVARVILTAECSGVPVPEELSESMDLIRAYMNASLEAIIEDTVGCLTIEDSPVSISEDTVVWDANPSAGEDLSRVQVFLPGAVHAHEAADRALGLLRLVLSRTAGVELDMQSAEVCVHAGERWMFYPCENPEHEWHPVPADRSVPGASVVTRVTIEPAF